MTDPLAAETPTNRRSVAVTIACRAGAGLAVILGSWCLWLALAAVHHPPEVDALDAWDDGDSKSAAPRQLRHVAGDSQPIGVEITDIMEADSVIRAVQIEQDDASAPMIHQIRLDKERLQHSSPVAPAKTSSSGAWLTGSIEEDDAFAELPRGFESPIPAWKRTTKSLKSALKSPARSADRR